MKKIILITSFFIAVMLLMPIAAVTASNAKIETQIKKNSDNYDTPILNVNNYGPFLEIEFDGLCIIIKNTGDEEAVNVEWSIDIDGLVFIGGHSSGTISSIPPGGEVRVCLGFILGIGPVKITITISAEDIDTITITFRGFLLGFFWIVI
ncbi:hypothetical protein MBGDN05_00734 [Thermoplasmatales archaeon SCGC AB-539-N05]|nr:hypothetical protein MBGDN05_00734 [Thermoplasmatales archaeon SCGC AB-539-N05]